MGMEQWWNDTEMGKTEVLHENPDSVALFGHYISH
jgi:hypothetical protein